MIGKTISHYSILEKLGEGGMGVVYKAQDTKLERYVALKFLPSHLNASEADKARFIQEAKAASALNHPNVCTIHDIQEHDHQLFIVMEYVDGQTLQEKKSSIGFKQAIDIGIQIAEGLAAAHEKGIVHRDIKPENIMIRKDGIAQIMDFGLAKLRGVSRITKEGSTVGTAGYMSPEQVQGQDVDHRSDIFSFGVVLYELVTGGLPFRGVHETALAYEIVNVDPPPMSSVKPDTDPTLDAIVLECLEKDPNERTQSARQVAVDLKRFKRESSKARLSRTMAARPVRVASPGSAGQQTVQAGSVTRLLPWIVSAVSILGAVGVGLAYILSPNPQQPVIRASISPPDRENFFFYGNYGGPPVISPDGRRIAFVAADSLGKRYLYVRALSSLSAQRLSGTEGAMFPFWSPDNQVIGFAAGALKKVDASGGTPVSICAAPNFRGASWNTDGTIIFSPIPTGALSVVSSSGGTPVLLTKLDPTRKENSHRWPSFLPDGKHFLYFARSVSTGNQGEGGAVRVASLDGKVDKSLVVTSSNGVYSSGHLLYVRDKSLVAQPFDLGTLELTGQPVTLAEGIGYDVSVTRALFTASLDGILLYQTGNVQLGSRLTLYDRSGTRLGPVSALAEYVSFSLSPDGRRVAAGIYDYQSHNNSVWLLDVARQTRTRFTFNPSYNQNAIWSPDGNTICYSCNEHGEYDLYLKPSSGAAGAELLLQTGEHKFPTDWSPDGKSIAFASFSGGRTGGDVWILTLADRKKIPIATSDYDESGGCFSPDGRWIAYVSDESGQYEVYLKSSSGEGSRWQVSTAGGQFPCWRKDGKEIYYIDRDNKIVAAEIVLKSSTIEVTNVRPLFEIAGIAQPGSYVNTADGKRFLVNMLSDTQNQTPLTLVVNWNSELRKQ